MTNSPMPRTTLTAAILIAIGMTFVVPAGTNAAPKGDGDSDIVKTLNKAQGMLRQLSQEKTALESKVAEMQKSLDDTTAQLAAKSAENQQLQTDFKQQSASLLVQQKNNQILTKNNEILKGNIDKLKEQLAQGQELLVQARNQGAQLSGELRTSLSDNELLVNAVKERTEWIQKTTDKNNQLVRSYREVLENFRNRSFLDTLAEAEPITGIASVAKENKIEEYRYKLNSLKVTPWQEGTSAATNQPPENP